MRGAKRGVNGSAFSKIAFHPAKLAEMFFFPYEEKISGEGRASVPPHPLATPPIHLVRFDFEDRFGSFLSKNTNRSFAVGFLS